MKKRNLLLFLLVAIVFISCDHKATSKIKNENLQKAKERDEKLATPPIAEFNALDYDFGTIKEGEKATGVFKVTNKGITDLFIFSAKGSCGCTVPEWPKEAIKPGETEEIKFTFDSSGRTGKQLKAITLKMNTESGVKNLRIKGFVTKK